MKIEFNNFTISFKKDLQKIENEKFLKKKIKIKKDGFLKISYHILETG